MPGRRPMHALRLRRPPRMIRSRARRLLACLLVLFVLFGALVLWADAKVRPLVGQIAKSKVHMLATQMINDAVSEYIAAQGLQYGDFIYFEKDVSGRITALKTDMSKVNAFKSSVLSSINNRLGTLSTTEISIPLGNIINGELFSGRGPGIPVRLVPYGVVNATFHNSFIEAGINQTRHQILMDVSVNIGVLLPGNTWETTVHVQVAIAETLIVGTVPDTYTQFGNAEIFERTKMYDSLLTPE